MKRVKGTIELKMLDSNVTAKCVWVGPIAIHKQPKKGGTFQSKNYAISNLTGFRILSLDGWLFREIVPMVEECLERIETQNILIDFKTWEHQAKLHEVFNDTAIKHIRLKASKLSANYI